MSVATTSQVKCLLDAMCGNSPKGELVNRCVMVRIFSWDVELLGRSYSS